MFVVVEGIEGSGKSTLLRARRAPADGRARRRRNARTGRDRHRECDSFDLSRPHVEHRTPDRGAAGERRACAHVAEVIRPALDAGRLVLCDRFTDSTFAYQGYGRGFDLAALQRLCDAATGTLQADLVFLLDLPSTSRANEWPCALPARPNRERGRRLSRARAPGLSRAGELAAIPQARCDAAAAETLLDEACDLHFDVVGAQGPKRYFDALTREKVSHAYLFSGPAG